MPEGHVIHRLAAAFTDTFADQTVAVSSPQGRFAAAAALLDGSVFTGAEALGKHLLLDFAADRTVWIHLGLIGKLRLGPLQPPTSPETLRLRVANATHAADLRGPQWCRLLTPAERADVMAACGPDPLRPAADPTPTWQRLQRSSQPVAQLLLDQRLFAGVGNIFRIEVLFRHGIDPLLPGKHLPAAVFASVWADLTTLMTHAVRVGSIDTVAPAHLPAAMGRPQRDDAHGGEVYAYRRAGQACYVCGNPIARDTLAGRNLFWCPTCQPPGSRGTTSPAAWPTA